MNIDVLTIFPEILDSYLAHGMVRRAIQKGQITVSAVDIRNFAEGRHRVTDDRPYGGGCGMVMKPEPLAAAIRATRRNRPDTITMLLTPQGRTFDQKMARRLVQSGGLILVCGRYEGVDERVCDGFIDDEISIGDFILTGGETAAMVIIDAVTRLIPGVLGGAESAERESFADDLLEHAHYTRPRVFEGRAVPEVLHTGNHKMIDDWRLETSLIRTLLKRRDLLERRSLSDGELEILKKWARDIEEIIDGQSLRGADPLSGAQ